MKVCHILTLTVDIKNLFREFEDIHWQIFLANFHENLTLPERVDSIFDSFDPMPRKTESSTPCKLEALVFTQGIFNIHCPSEDMADFSNLQGKLEPLMFT